MTRQSTPPTEAERRKPILVVGLPRSGSTWVATYVEPRGPLDTCVGTRQPPDGAGRPKSKASPRTRNLPPILFRASRPWNTEELRAQAFGESGAHYTLAEELQRKTASGALASLRERHIRVSFPCVSVDFSRHSVRRAVSRTSTASIRDERRDRQIRRWRHLRLSGLPIDSKQMSLSSFATCGMLHRVGSSLDGSVCLRTTNLRCRRARRLSASVATWGLPPLPADQPVARLARFLGLLTVSLEQAARRHTDWTVVHHEAICVVYPRRSFRNLAERLGLQWTEEADAAVASTNRDGRGFQIQRVAADLPNAWRSRLALEQIHEIESVLAPFPSTGIV